MGVTRGPTITHHHNVATRQPGFSRTVPVSDPIIHPNVLEIITFQCPNYSFKTAPHFGIGTKISHRPNVPAGF